MAPGALREFDRFWECPSYTPTAESIKALKEQLRLCHPASGIDESWITPGPQTIDSLDRQTEEDVGDACLQLNLAELQEIEEAVASFHGMCFGRSLHYLAEDRKVNKSVQGYH